MEKINVGVLNYLNVQPLLYGLKNQPVKDEITMDYSYPSLIAKALQEGTADVGIVSTAAMLTIPNARIVSDYGICADGRVASVGIFSHVPIEAVESLYLDYQSRTSVRLAEVLLQEYWHKEVAYLQAGEDYIDKIEGTTAGVIIGDRAFAARKRFPYFYDLATYWKRMTGLPFVFAAWIANKKLSDDFLKLFNEANAWGVNHFAAVIHNFSNPFYDVQEYFTHDILYHMTDEMHEGLALFMDFLQQKDIKVP